MNMIRESIGSAVSVLTALSVLLLTPGIASAVPIYHALLVGPEYPGGQAFDDTIAATRMKKMAQEIGEWNNWKPANITTLTGVLGANSWVDALFAKQQVVDDDDFFLLIYHGHGDSDWRRSLETPALPKFGNDGEKTPPNGIAVNKEDESFNFRNDATAEFHLTDEALGKAMRDFNKNATKLVIAISCFGGGMWGGGDGDMETASRIAFYGAVKEDQVCAEPPDFYDNLLKAIEKENTKTISIADWYNMSKTSGSVTGNHWFIGDIPGGISLSYESTIAGSDDVSFGFPVFVPEPSTLSLLGLITPILLFSARRRVQA